jgi:heme/copper-type cytochrome/quinol oxidase subunit 2
MGTNLPKDGSGNSIPVLHPNDTTQSQGYTGTASTAITPTSGVKVVMVTVTSAAFVSFNGTATSSDMYLPADTPKEFAVHSGDTISAIQVSASGTLYVTELE